MSELGGQGSICVALGATMEVRHCVQVRVAACSLQCCMDRHQVEEVIWGEL